MLQNTQPTQQILNLCRWTAMVCVLATIGLAPVLHQVVPNLQDPILCRVLLVSAFLGYVVMSFRSVWLRKNMQLILAALIYCLSAWLVWLNYLNDFHPALSYAIFEMLVGGSIAFTTMRGLFFYLSAAVIAAVVLVSMHPGVMIESLSYLSSMVVIAILVFLIHYWRSNVQIQFEETAARSVARLKKEAETHRLLVDTAMIATGEPELNTGARHLLEYVSATAWFSSAAFWDTRNGNQTDRPRFTIPDAVPFAVSEPFLQAVRTGEKSICETDEHGGWTTCYPIRDGQELAGVVEIRTDETNDPDNEGDWLLQQIAIQLGHIAERERTADIIQREARYDSLTSLPNRRAFHDTLEAGISAAKAHGSKLALLYIDLDDFKRVNDSLGHASGDEVLKVVSERLLQSVRMPDSTGADGKRSTDLISRVGGDEFALVLGNIRSVENANSTAQRILDRLAVPITLHSRQFKIGASIGIAMYPDDATDADMLTKSADAAMYTSKRQGGQEFSRFRISDKAVDALSFEADMRSALEGRQLEMHYQPVFDCASLEPIGAEALIRWKHPQRGWVSPGEFIPLAEELGLISEIGRFQFEETLTWFENHRTEFPEDFRVALNLSPAQIEDRKFIAWLTQRLIRTELPMSNLELEITETALLTDTPETLASLNALNELGLCLTLDDFGTGQSSLSLLKRFPIGRLKIDRSFVGGLPDRSDDVAIVAAVLSLAQSLGIPVVAEGVEEESQLHFLRQRQCEDMQGFLLAKPMPSDELLLRFNHTGFHDLTPALLARLA